MGFYLYENFYKELENYSRDLYMKASDSEKKQMIEDVFKIYREVNEYPIMHFTKEDMKDEVIKCYNKEIDSSSNFMDIRFNQGSSLCRFLFPNLRDVTQAGDKRTLNKKFQDDHMLKRAIEFCFKFKKSKCAVKPSAIKDGLEMLGGGVATNFKPMSAKFLYERFTPYGGTVYDFSSGYGGRLLGACTSKNNFKYIGTDPNTESFKYQQKLKEVILDALPNSKIELYNLPSEEILLENGSIDFAFSSPPYFNLEEYTDEESQSYIRYPNYNDWLKHYVTPTLYNCFSFLKNGGLLAINIADYNYKGKTVYIVDDWINIATNVGFKQTETINMSLQSRRGVGHDDKNLRHKKEGIFFFKK